MRHVIIDRDGRHLCSHVKYGNGRLMAAVPAMADVLHDLVSGTPAEDLRERAEQLLGLIGPHRSREPGEDDE